MVGNVEHGMMKSPPMDSTHGRQRRAWHAIIAIGQHIRSNDVGRGMPSSPLGSTYGRTTSGKACHRSPWTAHMVERRRVWHSIMDLRQHTRLNDVGRGMQSSPMDGKHGRTTSVVACYHLLWTAQTVGRRRAWHPSSVLGSTDGRTASGVACHHRPWTAHTVGNVGRGITSPPLDSTHGRMTSGVA